MGWPDCHFFLSGWTRFLIRSYLPYCHGRNSWNRHIVRSSPFHSVGAIATPWSTIRRHWNFKFTATLLRFCRRTFVWSVMVKSPRISPWITRALLLLDASIVPGGKMASPVYSFPSFEMKRTKRWALVSRGNRRSNGVNHIPQSSVSDKFLPQFIYLKGGISRESPLILCESLIPMLESQPAARSRPDEFQRQLLDSHSGDLDGKNINLLTSAQSTPHQGWHSLDMKYDNDKNRNQDSVHCCMGYTMVSQIKNYFTY